MYKNKKILALIPARGCSRGLPRKNVKPILGKPLIAWTIEQAKDSKYIDRIIVSTDAGEIAEISKKYGAEVPFMRPKKLANNKATGIDIALHTINWMEKHSEPYDLLILLQPTSPTRIGRDIDTAVELLFKKNAKAVISVCETEHHPYWSNILAPDGRMNNFINPKNLNRNRQDFPTSYRLNGAVYLAYWNFIKQVHSFFGRNTFAYIMPRERSVDVDNEIDFKFAEFLMKSRRFRNNRICQKI